MGELHAINLSTAWCPPPHEAGAWVRRFGRPAGIESGDAVWLVVTSSPGCRLLLNGLALPSVAPGGELRHDVTHLLLPRNELELAPGDAGVAAAAGASGDGRCPLPPAIATARLEIAAGPTMARTSA